ncbi:hypothetical protein SOVF_097480 [Spinacia oleracea]|nr:hypothetical protein SOVF_097480 [Spinacia oleracea]
MADEEQDPFAAVADDCRYSSSQEELLSRSKFARADEKFPDDDDSPPVAATGPGVSRRKLDGEGDSEGIRGGELATGDADSARAGNLGFRGERKRSREGEPSGSKSEQNCEGERDTEPELKKNKVSPLVHCSGKLVIEGEDNGEETVVFRGDLKVEKVSSIRSVPESGGCTVKLGGEDAGDDVCVEGKMMTESRAKKKVIHVGEDEGRGKVEGDGTSTRKEKEEDITKRRKRKLPRSMFELVWGEGTGDLIGNADRVAGNADRVAGNADRVAGNANRCTENSNRVAENANRGIENADRVTGNANRVTGNEGGLKESSIEGKGKGKSKGGEEETVCGENRVNANRVAENVNRVTENANRVAGNANGVVGNEDEEGCLKEPSIEGKGKGKSKVGEEETVCGEGSKNGNVETVSKEASVKENADRVTKNANRVAENTNRVTENANRVVGNEDVDCGLKEPSIEGKEKGKGKSKGGEEETVCGERSENGNVESILKEASVKENRDGKSKGSKESLSCILDFLKMLSSEKCSEDDDDDDEIDILETVKRRGLTFSRSRFLPEVEEDE